MQRDREARPIVERIVASGLEPEISAIVELEAALPSDTSQSNLQGIDIECTCGHEPFALDGSGGSYHVLGDGRILLVGSEGSAGVVAADFKEFVGIAIGLPGWRDALKFVGHDGLDAARAGWQAFVAKWGLDDSLGEPWLFDLDGFATATPAEARDLILQRLGAPPLSDPFGALHRAVNALNGDVVVTCHGEPLRQFGR